MTTPFPITPETVTRVKLDNGIILIVKDNPNNASVTIRGRLRAGGLYDTERSLGLAQFATSALQRGTRKRNFRKLNLELDRSGISFGIGGGMETIGFSGKSLVEDFDRLLDIAADVVLHPIFPPEETNKLRHQILADMHEAEHDTQHVSYREFRAMCYPSSHPYHRLSEGKVETIKRLTTRDLREFHTRYFRPDITTMVVVGDIRPQQAIEKIEKAFGRWKAKGEPPEYAIANAPKLPKIARKKTALPGKSQVDIALGYPAIRRKDPDFYALALGDLIFGRLGLYGRLGENVREKQGLAYYVYSSIEANVGAGPWAVYAGVNPKNADRAVDSIITEIKTLRSEPVTKDELEEAKDFLTGSLALRLETNDGVASALGDIELFDLGMDYLQRYPGIIRAITADQILAVTKKYAQIENYALSIAGPIGDGKA